MLSPLLRDSVSAPIAGWESLGAMFQTDLAFRFALVTVGLAGERAARLAAPHKDFSDLYEKMSCKGSSASEAHLAIRVELDPPEREFAVRFAGGVSEPECSPRLYHCRKAAEIRAPVSNWILWRLTLELCACAAIECPYQALVAPETLRRARR